jgi:hypothetical protein
LLTQSLAPLRSTAVTSGGRAATGPGRQSFAKAARTDSVRRGFSILLFTLEIRDDRPVGFFTVFFVHIADYESDRAQPLHSIAHTQQTLDSSLLNLRCIN